MKFKHLFLAILLLSIGLFLSYDKVEIKKAEGISSVSTNNPSTIIEDNSSNSQSELLMDESPSSEESIIQTNKNVKRESTKKDGKKTTPKKETKTNSNKPKETTTKEEVKEEPKTEETKPKVDPKPKEETKPQCSDFYESITHGKVDRSSKSACVSYGNKIQNNELDEVLDYNEEYGNVKKPTISYFRCYEVVDSNCNTKGWYLHFFCNSGGCDDNKLKSLYG